MEYRAVGNRCAVTHAGLRIPIPMTQAMAILERKGFKHIQVNLIGPAYECIGHSVYRRGARMSEAPKVVDCSSFIKMLFGNVGIWLPRRSIQQHELGEAVHPEAISGGDVIFTSGARDYYEDNPWHGIGHVGICTGRETVIHAANKKVNVVETPLKDFFNKEDFRGARRYIPKDGFMCVLEAPPGREVESQDDIHWIILQSL